MGAREPTVLPYPSPEPGGAVMFPTTTDVQIVRDLGALGVVLVVLGLILARRIITMGEKKDGDGQSEKRLADMKEHYEAQLTEVRTNRDEYKDLLKASIGNVARLADVLEVITGQKMPGGGA